MHSQSPKFPARKKELTSVISQSQIIRCWKKKVRYSLGKSLVADPYEWLDYHTRIDQIAKGLEKKVLNGTYRNSSPIRVLVEKSKGLCRQILIPKPEDALVMQLLSDALYADIKNKAPTNKSFYQPEDHSFSTKKKNDNGIPEYGSFAAWMSFQESIFGFSEDYKYIVITDVANFYDFINHSHLRNIISGQIDVRESILDVLVFTLSGLLWEPDYMPRINIGLPQMNVDAPRILAHCFLYELDSYLAQCVDCDFTRYMDDIDIGVNDIQTAKQVLRDIDLILQTRQVRLNSGKTKIITAQEAKIHFKIRENNILNALIKRIERKKSKNIKLDTERKLLVKYFNKSMHYGYFNAGNGEKILKRILSISGSINAQINEKNIIKIIKLRPAVRENALRYMENQRLALSYVRAIRQLIQQKVFVDHAAYHQISKYLLRTPSRKDKRIKAEIREIVKLLTNQRNHGFIAGLAIASKYLCAAEIYQIVKEHYDFWQIDGTSGRFVGSLSPFFLNTKYHEELSKLIKKSKNEHAMSSLSFSISLQKEVGAEKAIRSFLKAPNTSFPLKISHAKFGMLISTLVNPNVTKQQKEKYLKSQVECQSDSNYKSIIAQVMS